MTPHPASAPKAEALPAVSCWIPLPASDWDEGAARHLLRRAGWTARPDDVQRALADGMTRTLERLFPKDVRALPKPVELVKIEHDDRGFAERLRAADAAEKRVLRRQLRDRFQQGYQELALEWLEFSSRPAQSAVEKWVLCLSDIYVVAYQKVRNPALLHRHLEIIREHAFGPAPRLTMALSRSPALIQYLDLQDSDKNAPNENFARELFELFLLGEGNYRESDIKQAARAFTGYRQRFGEFVFAPRHHDSAAKSVFGKAPLYSGDDVIQAGYEQPAAETFLPGEIWRFYVSSEAAPPAALAALGAMWKEENFNLRALLLRIFGSRLFYAPAYRANLIKSPIQYYLGLVQDLELEVSPLARQVLGLLRQMGQMPLNPSNVRGWPGGRAWINSSTLAARRQMLRALFSPIDEGSLNADEQLDLAAAASNGRQRFHVQAGQFSACASLPSAAVAEHLVNAYLPVSGESAYVSTLARFIGGETDAAAKCARVHAALRTLLETPQYQLF
jgi:uncharacterized protein (DUF1800 family)